MFKTILTFLMIAIFGAAIWYLVIIPTHDARREAVLQVLATIPQTHLMVISEEALASVSIDDSNWLMGRRKGHTKLLLKIHWALDLGRLTPADVRIIGRHVTVTLPSLEVFDVTPDLASWEFYGSRSGLFCIVDALRSTSLRDDLFNAVQQALPSYRYADGSKYRPAVVERLNNDAAILFAGIDLKVTFQ